MVRDKAVRFRKKTENNFAFVWTHLLSRDTFSLKVYLGDTLVQGTLFFRHATVKGTVSTNGIEMTTTTTIFVQSTEGQKLFRSLGS